jgi:Putative DNA-binding domain
LPSSALWRLQAGFLSHVTGQDRGAFDADGTFAAPAEGTLDRRLAVYLAGYRDRIVEALGNDYPAVRRVLGAGAFGSLAVRYARAFPSGSHDLGCVGQFLPSFLTGDVLEEGLPFLPDLARLEWALAEAFIAADETPLAWCDLVGEDPATIAQRPLRLKAGSAVVRSAWPVLALWQLRDQADDAIDVAVEGQPQTVLVHRDGHEIRCLLADTAEADLVEAAAQGASLGDVDAGRLTSALVVEAFRRLVTAGVFARGREDETLKH